MNAITNRIRALGLSFTGLVGLAVAFAPIVAAMPGPGQQHNETLVEL